MNIVVSIIIPIYNVEPYILCCLQSVANQTLTEGVECILVDDCGKDKSISLAEEFVNRYTGDIFFKIVHHDHNKGLSAARNTGILTARGKYVYFLDSDDSISTDCIDGFCGIIKEHPEVDLVQGLIDQNSPYMSQFSSKVLPQYTDKRTYIKKALLDYDKLPVCAANKMVRRQLIIDNNLYFKEGIIHEDNHWSFFLAKYVKSIAINRKICYIYTENPSSITKKINIEREREGFLTIINDFCSNIDCFMRGEQKRCIFVLLRHFVINKLYNSDTEREDTIRLLERECNILERFILWNWKNNINNKVSERKWSKILTYYFRCNSVRYII